MLLLSDIILLYVRLDDFILIKKCLVLLILGFIACAFASASSDNGYQATVPVQNQSTEQRQVAIPIALHRVVDDLTQNGVIKPNADIDALFTDSSQFVESFSYQTVDQTIDQTIDQPAELMIAVRFDREALTRFFMQHHMMQLYSYHLEIQGVSSKNALDAVIQYLNQPNSVQSVIITQINHDKVTLLLTSLSDKTAWLNKIAMDQQLLLIDNNNLQEEGLMQFSWNNQQVLA